MANANELFDVPKSEQSRQRIKSEAGKIKRAADKLERAVNNTTSWWAGDSLNGFKRRSDDLVRALLKTAEHVGEMSDAIEYAAKTKKEAEASLSADIKGAHLEYASPSQNADETYGNAVAGAAAGGAAAGGTAGGGTAAGAAAGWAVAGGAGGGTAAGTAPSSGNSPSGSAPSDESGNSQPDGKASEEPPPANTKVRPVPGKSTQLPGEKGSVNKGGSHKGIDYSGNENDPVSAPVSGKIVDVVNRFPADYVNHKENTYGNYVVIEDADGNRYWLAHLNHTEELKAGDTINAGDTIGYLGHTGNTYGKHLHFEIRVSPYSWSNNQAPADMYEPFL